MSEPTHKNLSRRDALKLLGAAAGASVLANLPSKWSTPQLTAGVLPAHAASSAICEDVAMEIEIPIGDSSSETGNWTDVDPRRWSCSMECAYWYAKAASSGMTIEVTTWKDGKLPQFVVGANMWFWFYLHVPSGAYASNVSITDYFELIPPEDSGCRLIAVGGG